MREDVVEWLMRHGRLIEPDALDQLMSTPSPMTAARALLSNIPEEEIFITSSLVSRSLKHMSYETMRGDVDVTGEIVSTDETIQRVHHDIRVLRSPRIDGCCGRLTEFVSLFRDRYEKIRALLMRHPEMAGAIPISHARRQEGEVRVIGMVSRTFTSKRGNRIAEIDDVSGSVRVLLKDGIQVFNDEVIGVSGRPVRGGGILIAEHIVRPQIERKSERTSGENVEVAFISDLHVGSKNFLRGEWDDLIDFLNCEGPYGHTAEDIRYLIISGDAVDGIGVYPGQKEDLEITDVYDQYRLLADLLKDIPGHVKVVLQVGNHDAVRAVEPQPPLPDEIASMLSRDVMIVGNPTYLDIHGMRILSYHGRGMDDLITSCPGITYDTPLKAMRLMLDMRHMAPIYGGRTPLAPLPQDQLVIDLEPDIFVTGHVHSWGVGTHHGVLLINASTWQKQTEYQRLMNFRPKPGRLTIVNLRTMKPRMLNFYGG